MILQDQKDVESEDDNDNNDIDDNDKKVNLPGIFMGNFSFIWMYLFMSKYFLV